MTFGDRDKMAAAAKDRLSVVKSRFPKATLTGLDDLRVFYLLAADPKQYYTYANVEALPGGMDRKMALKKIGRSLKDLSREWQIINKLAS
jgi:hypothetical protein